MRRWHDWMVPPILVPALLIIVVIAYGVLRPAAG
jgi:hypothetical protein